MIYIGQRLGSVIDTEIFNIIVRPEGDQTKQLKYGDCLRVDKIDLLQQIKGKISLYKNNNCKLIFLNRVAWGKNGKVEPKIYKGRFYCRRRLALRICGINIEQIKPKLTEVK